MTAMAKKPAPLPPEKKRRNMALLMALLLFAAVIYGVTIIRIHVTGAP